MQDVLISSGEVGSQAVPYPPRSKRNQTSMLSFEFVAAGAPFFTAGRFAVAFEAVFNESSWVKALNESRGPADLRWFSVSERCIASGCSYLIPAFSLDDEVAGGSRLRYQTPRAKIAEVGRQCREGPPSGMRLDVVRHPSL